MSDFQQARDALARTIKRVFPKAKPVPRWAGVDAWGAPRPEEVVDHDAPGTYDPKLTVIGIADRKSGPVIYFLDPGDYFVLETERELLEEAGLKVGRGCIYHTRKAPLPTSALEELFRRVKARDERAAKGAPARKAAKPAGAPKTVDEYLARVPDAQRAALMKLRAQVRAAAPKATEKLSYGMPTWDLHGNLVHMAAFKDHLSFFPGRAGVGGEFARELNGYKIAKGTIQFTPEKPIPAALVKRIVKLRVEENEARAAKKGAAKKAAKRARAPAARTRGKQAKRSP